MGEIRISDRITCIEATDNPLSADIGIIHTDKGVWLYDVGNGEVPLTYLKEKPDAIVLSHFHKDHIGNIDRIPCEKIYVSKYTGATVQKGTVVENDVLTDNLRLFSIPSSHAKGCLGLQVDETYTFVGDALYCKVKEGFYVYNPQLLKKEIEVLKQLPSPYLLVSHFKGLQRSREEVIEELEEIYSHKTENSCEILVPIEKK